MDGIVTKLFDLDDIVFPEELFAVAVDAEGIEEKISILSLKYAAQTEVNRVSAGDTVFCSADSQSYPDGRTIILYTGVALPGAEDASQETIGKTIGDAFDAEICGTSAKLTVQRIVRRTPVPVTDELIASMGLENVTTIAAYRAYLTDLELAEQKAERARGAAQFALGVLAENSEFTYDEAELEAYIQGQMAQYAAECEAYGMQMDPGEMEHNIILQLKQRWIAKAYCETHGIELDLSGMEEEIDIIMQMQALTGEESMTREEYVHMFTENLYFAKLFEALNLKIQSVMEG